MSNLAAGWTTLVLTEARQAEFIYGPPTSAHEAYGVLAEEMAELLDAIRANDLDAIRAEAVQVSAVALRLACAEPTERWGT